MKTPLRIVLGSASPRRKRLLEQINLRFDVSVSDTDEMITGNPSPKTVARKLAERKAKDVASREKVALVIGADTIVVHNDEILGKPVDRADAASMLNRLSGQTHHVLTGVSIVRTGRDADIIESTSFVEETKVTFGALTEQEIDEYVESGSPMDKAGSYGIQDDWGSLFVERIEGDYYNVVGFPLHRFYQTLKSFAPDMLPHAIGI